MALLEASGIGKNFGETHVLKDISLDLEQGEALAIIGSSGSGKTTLLRCLNFLERPDTGVIKVNGETMWDAADPATQKESEIRKKRLHFGLVFQNFNLFPQYTALQNVMLAGELLAKERPEYQANKKAIHAELEQQARELLAQMGLSERAGHYPHQLSGGQQQRVAIARALANDPKVLLCDEATSALDPKTTRSILKLLREVNQRLGITIVVITHQMSVVKYICDRAAVMEKGRVVEEGTILEIFSHPKMPVTKGFIDTATNVDDLYELLEETRSGDGVNHGQTVYLLTYTGSSAGKPLMVELYQRFGVEANIIFGNVELLKGTPLGKLAVTLSGTPESVGDALEFIRSQNVVVEAL